MLRVGLTGGIASGKSVVGRYMQANGAYLIDADVLARQAVCPNTPVWNKVVKVFGRTILNKNGDIDREHLGAIIFANQKRREQLNNLIHPWVYAEYQRQAEIIARDNPRAILLFDVPLLFETHAEKLFDHIILAYVDKQTQIQRIIERDGLRRSEALRRIAAQLPLSKKRQRVSYVLDTREPLPDLRKTTRRLYKELCTL